jgi:hypothetical protein
VRRAVWRRDLGRCAFTGTNGRRCREWAFLEFHHVEPHAVGGGPTVANVQLRCRRHNVHEARVYFEPLRAYTAIGSGQEQLVLERVGK